LFGRLIIPLAIVFVCAITGARDCSAIPDAELGVTEAREAADDEVLALCAANPRAMSNPEIANGESGVVVRSTEFVVRADPCERDPFCLALLLWMKRLDGLFEGLVEDALFGTPAVMDAGGGGGLCC
jgi:hypothetical protein